MGDEERLCRLVQRGDPHGASVLPSRAQQSLAFHRTGENKTGNGLADVDIRKADVDQEVTHSLPRVERVDRLRETCCVRVLLGAKAEYTDTIALHHPMELAEV